MNDPPQLCVVLVSGNVGISFWLTRPFPAASHIITTGLRSSSLDFGALIPHSTLPSPQQDAPHLPRSGESGSPTLTLIIGATMPT